mgnify:CR=1 FL=1
MKIAVCVKQVPDSWAVKKMSGQVLDRAGVDAVLNDLDEYAIEEALRIVEANSPTKEAGEGSGHTITLISMGPFVQGEVAVRPPRCLRMPFDRFRF